MKIEIERVSNGFIVSGPNQHDDGWFQTVFEMSDNPEFPNRMNDGEDLQTWRNLLYFIMEQMGYFPSWNDENILEVVITDTKTGVENEAE